MNLNRILINTTTDITVTFYVGGTPTSLDGAVSVNAVNLAGTVVISGGVGIPTGSAGEYRYKLTPSAGTGTLDTLTVVWAGLLNGDPETVTTRVEIVGGFVFTIAEARKIEPLNDTAKYPTADIVAMRTTVEQAIEEEYGTALVPRYVLEPRRARDGRIVTRTPLRALRSLSYTYAGTTTAYTLAQITALSLESWAICGVWNWGYRSGPITVGYEYGLDAPTGRLRQGALRLARQWLVSGPIDDRALGAASPDGNFSFGLATPGRGGSIFGLPDLDAVVMSSPYRASVA